MTLVGACKIVSSRNDDEVDQTLQNFVCKMFIIGRTICFILALTVTVIAVITNSQNHTRRVPPTKPFFTRDTWVEDFYEGELYYALLKATKYDVIFLMLYAPWDADSQRARSEFETACRYFHQKVYCAAVNCWQSNARCKAVFDNIAMYPMFLVDLYHVPSIKYNGELIASHMIQFLSTVMKPLERIDSVERFHHLNSVCDNLVVSYFANYESYRKYYTSSLRHLEYDPRRDTCWSVVTNPSLANALNIEQSTVKLHLWNETKVFELSLMDKHLAKWVHDNSNFVSRWLFFTNAKSSSLAELLEHNPSVILFTPRNMHLNQIPSYLMLKEAALEFKNCGLENKKNCSFSSSDHWERIINEYHQWEYICKHRLSLRDTSFNSTIFHLIRQNYEKYVFTSTSLNNQTGSECLLDFCDTCWKPIPGKNVITSMLDSSKDDRSPHNLVSHYVREKCRQHNMLKSTFDYSYFTYSPPLPKRESIPSTVCRMNDTISFFAVDSLLYSHFATALGINLDQFKDRTAVVIFDSRDEETYVLDEEKFTSAAAILEFLVRFTDRSMPRLLKSTKDSSLYLNSYNRSENQICDEVTVLELHSHSFESAIFNSTQHVVVYFYSPFCSYCQVSAYAFLSVAQKWGNIPEITFARIDGENNDLPWNLVPLSYPTIIIFPANKKSENVVFPQSREITTENLYDFVLSNVNVEIQLAVKLDECNQFKNNRQVNCSSFDNCIIGVKTYCLQMMNKLLDKYKKIVTNSTATYELILSRLKFFKTFYLSVENL